MQPTEAHNEKIAKITFSAVFPGYIQKVEKKKAVQKPNCFR